MNHAVHWPGNKVEEGHSDALHVRSHAMKQRKDVDLAGMVAAMQPARRANGNARVRCEMRETCQDGNPAGMRRRRRAAGTRPADLSAGYGLPRIGLAPVSAVADRNFWPQGFVNDVRARTRPVDDMRSGRACNLMRREAIAP